MDATEAEAYKREMRSLRAQLEELNAEPAAHVKPRRLSLSEILDAHLETMRNRSVGSDHSTVKLTRNARGDTQIEVSVRTGESADVQTVEETSAKARATYDALRGLYPFGSESPDE